MAQSRYRIYELSARAVMSYAIQESGQWRFALDRRAAEKCRSFSALHEQDGNALFFSSALYLGTGLKGTEVKYGILPQPLYAEGDNYTSTLYGVSFFCIPKSVKDLHCSAVVLNAMNYLSNPDNDLGNESLTYQYYDTVVMGQVAQQPDDARMLELIRDSVYVDFAFMYDANLKLYTQFFNAVMNDSSITTLLGTIENSLPEALAKLIEAYQK